MMRRSNTRRSSTRRPGAPCPGPILLALALLALGGTRSFAIGASADTDPVDPPEPVEVEFEGQVERVELEPPRLHVAPGAEGPIVEVIVGADTRVESFGTGAEGLAQLLEDDRVIVHGIRESDGRVLADEIEVPDRESPDEEEDLVRFSLDTREVATGEEFSVPFRVAASDAVSLLAWTVEFDPDDFEVLPPRLSVESEERIRGREDETHFEWHVDPGEGWLQVSLVFDYLGRAERSLPVGETCCVAELTFRVRDSAEPGERSLSFTDATLATFGGNFVRGSESVYNVGRRSGAEFDDDDELELSEDAATTDGRVIVAAILGDVGVFARGDANLDHEVSLPDAFQVLNHLYRGGPAPDCYETADSNADTVLNLSDPVLVLQFLFAGNSGWRPLPIEVSDASVLNAACRHGSTARP